MGIKATPQEIDAFLAQQGAGPGTGVARSLVDSCTLVLPWPPSVNRYWRSLVIKGQVRVLLSSDGRSYRDSVAARVVKQGNPHVSGRLLVRVEAWPPDRRARDLDNLFKGSLDSLAHAGVIENDANIDALSIKRRAVKPDGELVVRIRRFGVNFAGELFE